MSIKACARFGFAAVLILAIGSPGTSQVPSRDRIVRPIDPTQVTVVRGTAHPLARPQFDQGRVHSDQPINGALVFRPSATQQADLDRFLKQQQDPSSPNYHQWLTPEQYADRFGMTQSDLAKVSAWLKSQGLTVNEISRGRTEIYFSGNVAEVEKAFRTEIHNYVVKGENHFANATPLSIPSSLVDVVLGVRGLDNFRPKPRSRVRPMTGVNPHFTSDVSGNHFLDPNDFEVIYNLQPLYNAGLDGTGVKIAVTGQTPLTSSGNSTTDLDAFRAASGLPAKDPSFVVVGTAPKFNSTFAVEADLDLEWSNAVAPNADVIFVYSGSAFDGLTHAVNQGLGFAQIISNSFGLCEADLGQSNAIALWQTIRQGNAQGQTITSATGDAGAADCDGDANTVPASASKGLSVDVPAAIPEVTGIGGTEFTGDSSQCANNVCAPTTACPNGFAPADSPFWGSGCVLSSPAATALEYIPEMVWNDTAANKQLSASGGGASTFFAKPSWQAGTGVPADGARDVPDVALNASPDHDPYLICSAGKCVNGFRNTNSTPPNLLDAVGGTSAGAPTFAGILALILQKTGGTGLGNVNPMLYSLAASSPGAFHDTTSGNNKVPCTSGTKNCPAGTTSIGSSAGQGYDQASGLGSVDAAALESAWLAAIASPPADFVMDGQASTVSPGSPGTATINVTATNGFADTVNLTCAASSTTAQISCSLSPTSVALTSSKKTGSTTLTITTVAALERPQGPRTRGLWFAATGGIFAAMVLGGIPSRRRWLGLFALVLLATAIGAAGCGGGGGGSTPQQKVQGTPAGTYTITITGTGANTGASHTLNVSLTVS